MADPAEVGIALRLVDLATLALLAFRSATPTGRGPTCRWAAPGCTRQVNRKLDPAELEPPRPAD